MASSSCRAETSVEQLDTRRTSMDRNAFALAIVSALFAGGCLGAMAADWSARGAESSFDTSSRFADAIAGALFLGAALNGVVSIASFAVARAHGGFFFILVFGAISAGPVGHGLMAKVTPVAWNLDCDEGVAHACYAAGRREAGLAADSNACEKALNERSCERLLRRDSEHASATCEKWRADCGPSRAWGSCAALRSGLCPSAPGALPMDPLPDSILDP